MGLGHAVLVGHYFYLKKLLFIFKRFSVVVSLMMIIALRGYVNSITLIIPCGIHNTLNCVHSTLVLGLPLLVN